jgi:DNA-binding protein HU-beta
MNKTELITGMAEKAEISKKDAEKALNAFTNIVADTLVDGDRVSITGFGTFEVVERAARTGRNPQTGESIQIQASKSPKFKAGKALKDAIKA